MGGASGWHDVMAPGSGGVEGVGVVRERASMLMAAAARLECQRQCDGTPDAHCCVCLAAAMPRLRLERDGCEVRL